MGRYEQPLYTVVARGDAYEIRRYDSHLVAETTVTGGYESTGNEAFRRLAGFIFGRNSRGARMNMTVPVTHEQLGAAEHRYRFMMERAYSEDSLPQPIDARVSVVRVPEAHYAAARYRGGRDERRFRRAAAALVAALADAGISQAAPPFSAVYDGPMVPAPFRRNEVLIPVSWSPEREPQRKAA